MAMMVQCELRSDKMRKITWLPQDSRIKVGVLVTLQKDDRRWLVSQVGMPVESGDIKRGWNNNI